MQYRLFPSLFSLVPCLLAALPASSQVTKFSRALNIPVQANGTSLENPWAGGEDAPVLQPIDLNGDGTKDLLVFEKCQNNGTHRLMTFINNGTAGQEDYHYAPEYVSKFPKMHDWVLLVDFNCDGKEDIFTYSYNGGMTVFRNDYSPGTGLAFTPYIPLIYSQYATTYANLFVSAVNQPALVDVDNDGDLDVLTFSLTGSNIEYHRNLAMENFGTCDTLVYKLEEWCWGGVCLSASGNTAIFGCCLKPGDPDYGAEGAAYVARLKSAQAGGAGQSLHSGSCMIAPDIDGDNDRDPLNGDILGDNVLEIINTGTPTAAAITAQDSLFPSYNVPAILKTFPGPYYFDADNDGNKDLVVAPCVCNASRNFRNILFYKNTTNNTTNQFSYKGDSLLVHDMIDVGTNASVSVADMDGDGLKDIIIGNYRYVYQTAADDARIAYFKNTGTAQQPAFTLVTDDLAGLSTSGLFGLSPAVGDLDGDGDADMIVGYEGGYLSLYQNNGGTFTLQTAQVADASANKINVGNLPSPVLYDLDGDNDLDLVIGENNGNLNYFENTGNKNSYAFTFVTDSLGHLNTTKYWIDLYGASYPFFTKENGNTVLYCGTLSGYVYRYDNIDGNLGGTFTLTDSLVVFEPYKSTLSGADIDNDGLTDLLVGNRSGGVTWYMGTLTSVAQATGNAGFELYPNPVSDLLQIHAAGHPKEFDVVITDSRGRLLYSARATGEWHNVDTGHWPAGLYLCRIVSDGFATARKFVIGN